MSNRILKNICLVFFLYIPLKVFAEPYCQIGSKGNNYYAIKSPIPTLEVGEDAPIGQVIYSGSIEPSMGNFYCYLSEGESLTIANEHVWDFGLITRDYGSLGGEDLGNNIYSSSVPGVGIRAYYGVGSRRKYVKNILTEASRDDIPGAPNISCEVNTQTGGRICEVLTEPLYFEFIKTGPIGNEYMQLYPSWLGWEGVGGLPPTIKLKQYVVAKNGVTHLNTSESYTSVFMFNRININVKAYSCETPGDFSVGLGSHELHQIKETGSSLLVDAGIVLTNCPTSTTGYFDKSPVVFKDWKLGSIGREGRASKMVIDSSYDIPTASPNTISVSLRALTPVTSALEGRFSIEDGGESATGIDIQVLKNDTSTSLEPWSFNDELIMPAVSNLQSRKIPLFARYVLNGEPLKPGTANGKLMYIISYK